MSSTTRATRSRKAVALVASGATLLAVAVVGFAPGTASASSHREAPLIVGDPLADNTDTYAFVSPDDPTSVTLIANWIPFEEPNGGPNFYPWGTGAKSASTPNQGYTYNIKIDSNGDGVPDITYRWTFTTQDTRGAGDGTFLYNNGPVTSLTDPNLLFRQTYTIDSITTAGVVTPIVTNAPVAPSNVGVASMPNYNQDLFEKAITPVTGGGKSYAGQADDPFFLDLRVFDLLYGGNLSEVGQDSLRGYNVNTVSLQLPKSALALNGDATRNPVIGVWSTTDRATVNATTGAATNPVQVSRLGQPLVNEVVVPANLKDAFNSIPPTADATIPAVVKKVIDPEVPKLVAGIYGVKAPTGDPGPGQTTNRTDIAEIFLTGVTTKLDGKGFYGTTLGAGSDKAPIAADLNSQLLNADSADATKFQPSEELRLNMSINGPTKLVASAPMNSRLGVAGNDLQGFPNGRRLTDDVVDIELAGLGGFFLPGQDQQAAVLVGAGVDKVDSNITAGANDDATSGDKGNTANGFRTAFPYIAAPNHAGVNTQVGGTVAGPTTTVTVTAPAAPTSAAAGGSNGGIKTPVGGVDTGAGGNLGGSSALPLVSGALALLLLGAGGATLVKGRRRSDESEDTTAE